MELDREIGNTQGMEKRELAVIGAGPCGLAVGIAARTAGLDCVIFDKGCVVRGLTEYPTNMTFFSTADKLEIGNIPFIATGAHPTRQEALKYYRRVAGYFELDVRQYQEVIEVDGAEGDFRIRTRSPSGKERTYQAGAIVIATGYFDSPNMLGVPGEDLPKVSHYYREAHPYHAQDVVVIGGANSAVEASLELFRAGARVTLVHFGEGLDPRVKPWVLPDIRGRIESGEIVARWRTRVVEIRPESVVLRSEDTGELSELENDFVLALTGFRPDHGLLRSLGGRVDEATGVPIHDPTTMETTVPGVFLSGVVAAGYDANKIFIENGRDHGGQIVTALERRGFGAANR
ncbi:MAG TPA: YpdA family putative bacillithiol disulfide reductase [Longimicrobiales bacterium]|nr:YpdA family putative bacillithiol disulfide reductase [Longimicrobiales bacterium]